MNCDPVEEWSSESLVERVPEEGQCVYKRAVVVGTQSFRNSGGQRQDCRVSSWCYRQIFSTLEKISALHMRHSSDAMFCNTFVLEGPQGTLPLWRSHGEISG